MAPILKKKLPWLWSFCVVFLLRFDFVTGPIPASTSLFAGTGVAVVVVS